MDPYLGPEGRCLLIQGYHRITAWLQSLPLAAHTWNTELCGVDNPHLHPEATFQPQVSDNTQGSETNAAEQGGSEDADMAKAGSVGTNENVTFSNLTEQVGGGATTALIPMAGQGTTNAELFEERPQLSVTILPC